MDYQTLMRDLGIGLAVIGVVMLVGYSLYELFTSESSMILKLSITAIVAGIVLAILSLITEKMGKQDSEVERKY
ncbi:MAG: hypothetical protein M8353_04635 [ANME-2 cluster archaeon]|nr:hypothetical protein [ANME-2 cluster archaeon]